MRVGEGQNVQVPIFGIEIKLPKIHIHFKLWIKFLLLFSTD